eukprot:361874-Chlamydomonas_euryale.AAC.3
MAAGLAAEARRQPGVAQRQPRSFQPAAAVHRAQRLLACGDEEFVGVAHVRRAAAALARGKLGA